MARPTKFCPYCAEEIYLEAIKCKHCGSMLNDESNDYESNYHDIQGGVFGDRSQAIKADDVKGHIVQANGPVNFMAGETEEEKKQRVRDRDYILARNWDKVTLLQKLDLAHRDLSKVDLSNSNLTGSDLSTAKFLYSDLTNAKLGGTIMNGTDFSNADLSYANLSSNRELRGTVFSHANLDYADFRNSFLAHAIFIGSSLKKTNFKSARFVEMRTTGGAVTALASEYSKSHQNKGEDKEKAKKEAQMITAGAFLFEIGLNLLNSKTKINTVGINQADLKNAKFDEANFEGAYMQKINLEGCQLINSSFRNTNIKYSNLRNSDLRGADLSAADLTGADMSGANLCGARFVLSSVEMYKSINLQNTIFDIKTQFHSSFPEEYKRKMRYYGWYHG